MLDGSMTTICNHNTPTPNLYRTVNNEPLETHLYIISFISVMQDAASICTIVVYY